MYLCEFLLQQFIEPAVITNKTIGSGTGGGQSEETYGDIYPSGSNPIKPGIRGISVGTSEQTGNGVFVGTGIVQSPTNTDNSGLGLKDAIFGTNTNGSVAMICEDFEVNKSDTLYIGNYEMYPSFLSGGNVKTITSNYNVTKDDWFFICDTTVSGFTMTLPDPTGLSGKHWVFLKTHPSQVVTIDTATTALINGNTDEQISNNYEKKWIVCDGSNYYVIGNG